MQDDELKPQDAQDNEDVEADGYYGEDKQDADELDADELDLTFLDEEEDDEEDIKGPDKGASK